MNTKQLLKMIKTTINNVLPCNDLNGFEIAINTGYEIAMFRDGEVTKWP